MSDTELPAIPLDAKALRCCDCHGWPIDEGAVFVAVFLVRDGKPILGAMCELCWLKRLHRRAEYVRMSSKPMYHVNVPGLHEALRDKRRGRP